MKKIVSIILICTLLVCMGAISVFADNPPTPDVQFFMRHNYYYNVDDTRVGGFRIEATSFSGQHLGTIDHDRGSGVSSGERYSHVSTFQYQYKITLFFYNNTSEFIRVDKSTTYYTFKLASNVSIPSTVSDSWYSWTIDDPNQDYVVFNANDTIQFYLWDFRADNGNYYIPPYYNYSYDFYMTMTLRTIQYDNYPSHDQSFAPYSANIAGVLLSVPANVDPVDGIIGTTTVVDDPGSKFEDYNIHKISNNVQSILDQYTANVQNAEAVTDGTSTNEQTLSNIGTNEDTWFTQNDQALQATGITNFNYTPSVTSGMNVINEQFLRLWAALGDWNFVYTFSMMLGLVVLILRHNPQRKKTTSSTSGGGGKSANSS